MQMGKGTSGVPIMRRDLWGLNLPETSGVSVLPSAAHASHAAAHHLVGDGVCLCPVDDQRASRLLAGSVIVESTLCSDIKRSSCEDQVGVGINRVCIA